MIFIPPGQTDGQVLNDFGFQVEIAGITAPPVGAGYIRPETGETVGGHTKALPREAVRAIVDIPGVRSAGLDLELFLAVLQSEGEVQRGGEQAHIERSGDIEVEGLVKFPIATRFVRGRNARPHGRKLGVNGVVHIEAHAVLAEAGAHVIRPAVQQHQARVGQFAAQAESDAPVLNNPAEARGEAARKALVEEKAVVGQMHIGVVRRGVGRYCGTALAGTGQVGHPDGGRTVFKRVAPEHAAPGVGVAEEETAFDFALRIVAEGIHPTVHLLQVQTQVAEELIVVLNLGRAPNLGRRPAYMLIAGFDQPARVVTLDAAAGFVRVQELEAEVGKAVVGQRQAQVGGHFYLVAVAVVVLAVAGLDGQALGVFAQPKVQNAGDGVRAVLGRGSVAQDFNAVKRNGRNHGNVGSLRAV